MTLYFHIERYWLTQVSVISVKILVPLHQLNLCYVLFYGDLYASFIFKKNVLDKEFFVLKWIV